MFGKVLEQTTNGDITLHFSLKKFKEALYSIHYNLRKHVDESYEDMVEGIDDDYKDAKSSYEKWVSDPFVKYLLTI